MHSSDLIKELKEVGCFFVRHGKGDHQIWQSPITGKRFTVPHPKQDLPIGTLRSIKKSEGCYSSAELSKGENYVIYRWCRNSTE